jgi:uncharacterized protein (TIGR02145 family)
MTRMHTSLLRFTAIAALLITFNACDTEVDDVSVNIDSAAGAGATDVDGNTYATVVLGNGQEWLAENLRTTSYANGDPIPLIVENTAWTPLSSGARAIYENEESNVTELGMLYNWFAVNDERNICPDGWHVPTVEEWDALYLYLDPSARNDTNPRSLTAGAHLKATGTEIWQTPNEGATDLSGLAALPGGFRHSDGVFYARGQFCYWWTATERNNNTAFNRYLYYGNTHAFANQTSKRIGYAVRCLKD